MATGSKTPAQFLGLVKIMKIKQVGLGCSKMKAVIHLFFAISLLGLLIEPVSFVLLGMLITAILLGLFIIQGGQGPIAGDDGSECCPNITVKVGSNNANLDGEYKLIDKNISTPGEECINDCIYTKEGSPSTDEYCIMYRVPSKDYAAVTDVNCMVQIRLLKSYNLFVI